MSMRTQYKKKIIYCPYGKRKSSVSGNIDERCLATTYSFNVYSPSPPKRGLCIYTLLSDNVIIVYSLSLIRHQTSGSIGKQLLYREKKIEFLKCFICARLPNIRPCGLIGVSSSTQIKVKVPLTKEYLF